MKQQPKKLSNIRVPCKFNIPTKQIERQLALITATVPFNWYRDVINKIAYKNQAFLLYFLFIIWSIEVVRKHTHIAVLHFFFCSMLLSMHCVLITLAVPTTSSTIRIREDGCCTSPRLRPAVLLLLRISQGRDDEPATTITIICIGKLFAVVTKFSIMTEKSKKQLAKIFWWVYIGFF